MKLVIVLCAVGAIVSGVAISSARSLGSARPTPTPVAPRSLTDPIDLAGVGALNCAQMTYHLLHGDWSSESLADGRVIRYRPSGTGIHCVEMAWTVAYSDAPLIVNVPVAGEVYELAAEVIIDFDGRGSVELGSVQLSSSPFCDSDKTLVISNVMTGECWENPYITDPETGAYTRKCNKTTGSDCKATVTQNTSPPTVSTTTWDCGASDRTVSFNPSTGIWGARNAKTCGVSELTTGKL